MPEKILIIDDDIENVEVMKVFLMRLGYHVIVAYGGALGIELAHQKMPDLIILDVMMPGMDGFEVARSLHHSPDTTTIPILMITALNRDDHRDRGYESGADIYLTRPIQHSDFQAHVKALLMQHRARSTVVSSQGHVVGVLAAKGGVGVSTVALNLAVSCGRQFSIPTIAAELCPGRGTWADELCLDNNQALDILLGFDPAGISVGAVESLLTMTNLGVRLLLASNGISTNCFDKSTPHFEAILMALRAMAPLLVLDAGTHFAPSLGAVLTQCSELVVVTEPQPLAVRQTGRLLDTLSAQGFGTSKPLSLVTVNRTCAGVVMPQEKIEALLKRPVAQAFPPALELSTQALNENLPLVLAQPASPTAQQFAQLAAAVKVRIETNQ